MTGTPPRDGHGRRWLADRSTGDLLMLMLAGTLCVAVLGTAAAAVLAELLHPDQDTASVVAAVGDVLGTFLGLVAGYLAGRTDRAAR